MYNDLNNELFEKYFNSDERSKIWKDSIDLVSDILYFEEHMSRMKKSNFNFKVNFSEYCNERSLQILFRNYSCLGINTDTINQVLVRYNLTKFFINKVYNDELTPDIEKDLVSFSNYWSNLYKTEGIAQFVSDFVGCSHGIHLTEEKIISIIKNHHTEEKRED